MHKHIIRVWVKSGRMIDRQFSSFSIAKLKRPGLWEVMQRRWTIKIWFNYKNKIKLKVEMNPVIR